MRKFYRALFAPFAIIVSASAFSAEVNVQWTNALNADATGNTLQRTGGCDGCRVSGAMSAQQIRDGNGHLSFTATDSGSLYYVGLSHGEEFNSTADIDFAFRLQEGTAEIRENDTYLADTPYAANDVFKIVVEDGQVRYYKNNSLVHTSDSTAEFPLVALAGLVGEGARVADAKIGSPSLSNELASGNQNQNQIQILNQNQNQNQNPNQNQAWTNTENVQTTRDRIQKTGGCDGCDDAGAISTQTINSGDGYVEFRVEDPDKLLYAGLNSTRSITSAENVDETIDFALRFQEGVVEVREDDNYKADTTFDSGDTFRVAVSDGVVRYYKNGESFYESSVTPEYPLVFDADLFGAGALITGIAINSGPYRGGA